VRPHVIYDFYGFPHELYQQVYSPEGAPILAEEVRSLLEEADIATTIDAGRGLDHGIWVPLRLMFPRGDVPIVPVSLPSPRTPGDIYRIGQILAPLLEDGVMLVGSGGLVHNLIQMKREHGVPVDEWALLFENWMMARVEDREIGELLNYRDLAPFATSAAPTPEHLDPIFFALGAGADREWVENIYTGIDNGNMSLRCFALR
jgi:4,5-DOPA dioxygenase extradiol